MVVVKIISYRKGATKVYLFSIASICYDVNLHVNVCVEACSFHKQKMPQTIFGLRHFD